MSYSPSILVVDDEPDICANLRDILTEFGYHVDTACNGPAALELVERGVYDIALLDLKMPGMNGVDLYREIKRRSSQTIAIVISAYAGAASAKDALDAGAWRILSKPVDVGQVLQCIGEALVEPLVMVVDDDQELCASLWDVLHHQGIRTKVVHHLADADAALGHQAYQVAIIDLKLPGGDGLSFCERVRARTPTVKTILITGHRAEVEDRSSSLQTIDATCFKPLEVDQLLAAIRRFTTPPDA